MQCAISNVLLINEQISLKCSLTPWKGGNGMAVDRRVRKTQNAIKKAFISLLEQKDLDHITVSDISEAADINRGTFYLHYEDKYILLEKMENEYAQQLYDLTRVSEIIREVSSAEDFYEIFSKRILKNVLEHISDNLDFYRVILTLERRSILEEKIYEIILENLKDRADEKGEIGGVPVRYFHRYVCGSMTEVIKFWVQDEESVEIDILLDYIGKIVMNGPLRLIATDHVNQTKIKGELK